MFHVPGSYSGAKTDAFAWTQTREGLELIVPLAAGAKGSVTYAARSLRVCAADGPDASPVLEGELNEVVVVDDCVWTREDAPRQLCITLRKAVPAVWARLLRADAELTPVLLDGRFGKPLEGAPSAEPAKGPKPKMPQSAVVPHLLSGLKGTTVELTAEQLPPVAVLLIRDCSQLTVRLPPDATVVKVSADSCDGLTLELAGRVTTETLELYKCTSATITAATMLRTVQLDECGTVALTYLSASHFERVVQTNVSALSLHFLDASELELQSGLATLLDLSADPSRPEHTAGLPVAGEQFITRVRPQPAGTGAGGQTAAHGLLTEHVRRLANDFPSTQREAREYAERTRVNLSLLGIGAGGAALEVLTASKELTNEERVRLEKLAADAQAEVAAAAAAAEAAATFAIELATRVGCKKGAGNAAFSSGDWHEAAVRYTEAIALLETAPSAAAPSSATAVAADAAAAETLLALRANRAAAFLKLGRYEQALADSEFALAASPAHAKAAFRKGLALQALERFDEAIFAFAHASALEPSNGQVSAALRMAEMQLRRKRAQDGSS
ncbi:hypothetical protein T492DRAFT_1040497 [Pavlovales sp. CCMP2436]|nr:hypothetical protein T492DRAFT_1040497 [Pavlovales sp. CCMP2436]